MDKIKIHMLHCGHVLVSPNLPFGYGNLIKASGFFEPEKDKIWLPVSTVYIEHPKAKILIDTGWNRAMSPDGKIDKEAQIEHLSHFAIQSKSRIRRTWKDRSRAARS